MRRKLHWYDIITINIYYFGLTTLTQTMAPLVLPLLVQQFVGETQQGTYFGTLRLWGLMMALLTQALIGMLSDRTPSRWGRRRPFVFGGTLLCVTMVAGIGLSASFEGTAGFWVLFGMYVLQQMSANMAHSSVQGLIPDLVPEGERGKYSGVKALFEVPLPIIFVSLTIARLVGNGNLWGGLDILMGVLLVTMLLTMLVREQPLATTPPPLDWQPFIRLLLMTGLFTVIILVLGEGVKLTGKILINVHSTTVLFVVMGLASLLAMSTAMVLGVWGSVQISLGRAQARRSRTFTWWVIGRLAFLVGAFNLSGFLIYFLQLRLGYTKTSAVGPATQMMMLIGGLMLISALVSGWITDKLGRKQVSAASGLVAALGTLIILFATNLTLLYIGGALIGLATGAFYTANWALGTSLVPEDEAGRYLGISNLAGAGAGAVGAYIGGPTADFFTTHVPQTPGLGYILLFAVYGLLFLVSVGTLRGVSELRVANYE
ncbi:MAG: MFS transporter [Anaerolineae bacterium]|nr:MFS transporter [Anaerolineae bacterium]